MKWKLNLPEHQVLVYYFTKLIGLAPFSVKNNRFHPLTLLDKVYSTSITTLHLFATLSTLAIFLRDIYSKNIMHTIKIGNVLQNFTSFLTPFIIIVTFLFMNKKILYLMNELCTISDELKNLGIEEDTRKFFKNLFLTTLSTNAVLVATCVVNVIMEPNWPIFATIIYSIDTWFYFNTVFIFAGILFLIRQRFKLIDETLYETFGPIGNRRNPQNSQIFVVSVDPREANEAGIQDSTNFYRIRRIEAMHLHLCDLVDRTIHIFSIPILFKGLGLCIELMMCVFWMYDIVRKPAELYISNENFSRGGQFLFALIKMTVMILQLVTVANASVKTRREGNAIKATLFKVWYKFKPRKLQDEFVIFALQLLHKPVTVSAFGFFDLDYSYVYKIFGAVVGYVIVMIQFGGQSPTPDA